MPTFQYRALTQVGEVVTGSLDATSLAEVNRRVEYLGLIPIEAATARNEAKFGSGALSSALPSLNWAARGGRHHFHCRPGFALAHRGPYKRRAGTACQRR